MKAERLQLNFILAILIALSCSIASPGQSVKKKDDFGKSFFEKDSVHTIKLNFHSCNYWDSLVFYKKRQDSLEIPLYMQASVTIDGKSLYACGVRFKGESSYQFYPGKKKPFRIKFDRYVKGQDFNGLTELNLNNNFKDPTMVREKIYLDLMKRHGLPAPRATYAKVYLNDKYLGLYLITENIDDVFLETRFNDSKGNLFQGEPLANLVYLGNDQKKYFQRYILRNNRKKNDWSDLVKFIRTINDTTLSEAGYAQKLESVFDLDKCLKSWAINNLLGNIDAYNMFYPHNYFLFHDSLTNRWHWISLDGNYAFAAWNPVLNFPQISRMSILKPDSVPYKGDRPLLDRTIVQNRYLREKYLQMVDNLLLNDLMPDRINSTIDSLKQRIRTAVYADVNKMYSNTDFDTNFESTIGDPMDPGNFIPGLKVYMNERRIHVEQELEELRKKED
ncbi:MAG: CotH kinase family protein [Bacteroidota bacterium]